MPENSFDTIALHSLREKNFRLGLQVLADRDRDLALAIAVQKIKKLPTRPTPKELATIAENWRSWRAIAARILWHYYLNQNKF